MPAALAAAALFGKTILAKEDSFQMFASGASATSAGASESGIESARSDPCVEATDHGIACGGVPAWALP